MKSGELRRLIDAEHSKAQCERITRWVGNDKIRFQELVDVFLAGPYRVTQRAAWPLSNVAERHPELVSPHLGRIISILDSDNPHAAVKRNVLRLLQYVDIPNRFHEKLIEHTFEILNDRKQPVAIQVFAMEILSRLIDPYPELQRELSLILEEHLPLASAGYRSRAVRILARLRVTQH